MSTLKLKRRVKGSEVIAALKTFAQDSGAGLCVYPDRGHCISLDISQDPRAIEGDKRADFYVTGRFGFPLNGRRNYNALRVFAMVGDRTMECADPDKNPRVVPLYAQLSRELKTALTN